ncbi:MAG: hypothetical protein M1829_004396 [Trizodia sp. TS-e1964]|nr:MAG: hypothetical protein M1829_004396 [Trizodia sp. TS-e1964]
MSSPSQPPLASLSLTHVHYNPTDPLSHLSAYLALAPQALCVAYATLLWSTREAEIFLLFTGQLACEVLNFVLKRWIKEARPKQMHGRGYGMPSSHAQFAAFFAVSLALFLLLRQRVAGAASTRGRVGRMLLALLVLLGAAGVAGSRVYLNYHTPKQVLVGWSAGAAFAGVWFLVTAGIRGSGVLGWALDTPLARVLRVRDLVVTEDLADAGWEKWCRRRRLEIGQEKKVG